MRWLNIVILNLLILLYAKSITIETVLVMVSSSLALLFANLENNLYDREIDKLKGVKRTVVSRRILLILVFLSTSLAFFTNEMFGVFLGICIILSHAYNSRFSKYPVLGNLLVSLTIGLGIYALGFVFGFRYEIYILSAFAFLLNFQREVVKSYMDRDYDVGRRTIAKVLSENNFKIFLLMVGFLNTVLILLLVRNAFYTVLFGLSVILNFLSIMDMKVFSFVLKLFMVLGILLITL